MTNFRVNDEDSWMFYKGQPINFPVPEGVAPPIHCLGDSHINILLQTMPRMFFSTRFASIAAYSVAEEKMNDYVIESLAVIPEGSKVLAYFGEIDCRHYIPHLALPYMTQEEQTGETVTTLTIKVVNRYTKNFLSVLQRKYRMIVVGPYVCPEDHYHAFYPPGEPEKGFSNSYNDILLAKTVFNTVLKDFCEKSGIAFVPIFYWAFDRGWDRLPVGTYFNDGSHMGPSMIPVIFDAISGYKWKEFEI